MYNIWYLNLALKLRNFFRGWSFNRNWNQRGTIEGELILFFELLLDLYHQETFSYTIPNKTAQTDKMFACHVPKLKK